MDNMSKHTRERAEDKADRKEVSDARERDSVSIMSIVKVSGTLLGSCLLLILGVMGWNLRATYELSSSLSGTIAQNNQWQTDHGEEIDQDNAEINEIFTTVQSHWRPATSTNITLNQ
jgi:hypothetical protein